MLTRWCPTFQQASRFPDDDSARQVLPIRRIMLRGIRGAGATISLYDRYEDRTIAVPGRARKTDLIEVVVPLVDHPRLLIIAE